MVRMALGKVSINRATYRMDWIGLDWIGSFGQRDHDGVMIRVRSGRLSKCEKSFRGGIIVSLPYGLTVRLSAAAEEKDAKERGELSRHGGIVASLMAGVGRLPPCRGIGLDKIGQ